VNGLSTHFTTPDLSGIRLHTLSWGETGRPELILLHGGGANAHWWDHIAPLLSDRFHVTALDFRGHGASDFPEEVETGGFDSDLEALVDHLATDSVFLIGHSMGARVALDFASKSEKTRALVLIDLARGGDARQKRRGRLALALRRSYASREEAIERYRFLPAADRVAEPLRDSIARKSIRCEPDGRFSYAFDPRWFGVAASHRPDPGGVECPVLILRGEESRLLTEAGAQELAGELREARLEVVASAGHHVQLDQPDMTSRLINDFLDDVCARESV